MKYSNEKQQRNTAMTFRNEKQHPYNNQTNNKTKEKNNNFTTIIQQTFNNEKPMKHTNETRQWNTTMKNNI